MTDKEPIWDEEGVRLVSTRRLEVLTIVPHPNGVYLVTFICPLADKHTDIWTLRLNAFEGEDLKPGDVVQMTMTKET